MTELTTALETEKTFCMDSRGFWSDFIERYWEKRPLAILRNFTDIPFTSDHWFPVVAEHCRTWKTSVGPKRFFVEGQFYENEKVEKLDLFPKQEDGNFRRYDRRVRRLLDNKTYMLALDDVPLTDSQWDWAFRIFQGLFRSLGYLGHGHFPSLFFGNYGDTAFGVHHHPDPPESAFYFPIEGAKSMRVWPPGYVNRNPGLKYTKDYRNYIEASTLLQAESGGLLYWPSDWWHVGAARGGEVALVFAVNTEFDYFYRFARMVYHGDLAPDRVKAFMDGKQFESLLKRRHWRQIIDSNLEGLPRASFRKWKLLWWQLLINLRTAKTSGNRDSFDREDMANNIRSLPEGIRSTMKVLGKSLNYDIPQELGWKFWLKMLTGWGFRINPTPRDQKTLGLEDRIQARPGHHILWKKVSDATVLLSAAGFCQKSPAHAILDPLLKVIQSQECHQVKHLIEKAGNGLENVPPADRLEAGLSILNTLWEMGGIRMAPNECS